MRRKLIMTLLAAVLVLTLLPAAAAAEEPPEMDGPAASVEMAEPDTLMDAAENGEPEIPAPEADPVADTLEIHSFQLPVIDPRYPLPSVIDNSEDDPNAVPLADRRAARCIDRVRLPQFARDFYDTLERESKPASRSGLGRDGALIDPTQSPNLKTINDEEVYVISLSLPTEDELRASGFQFEDYMEFIGNCLGTAFGAFDWEHPEVFWLHGGYGFFYDLNNYVLDIVLAYKGFPADKANWDIRAEEYRDSDTIRKDINALSQSVDSIVREANRTSSNFEKINYFNEWLTTNNQYNYTIAYTGGSASRMTGASIGALTTKDGRPGGGRTGLDGPVCSGYAKAFMLLCQEAGIPCCLMTGANHAWNYVQVDPSDSRWYAVDVTWNDPTLWGTPTLEEYVALGANSNMESTAYTLVGADTIVSAGGTETFLDNHPEFGMIGDENYIHANFKMAPELSRVAYVDSLTVQDLDIPAKGAAPDTRVTLTSAPKSGHHPTAAGTEELFINPVVTWSPAPVNGKFADGTVYTATISCTPLRQGYGLTAADASKITVEGAEKVTVNANGDIQAVFPRIGGDSGLLKAEDFTCNLPVNLVYDGTSKTAAVRVSSSIHNGRFTLVFTDDQGRTVADIVKPGSYRVTARVSAHGSYPAGEVFLGSVSIKEGPGLHGSIALSFGDASQKYSGVAYVIQDELISIHVTPDPGYKLGSIQVLRDDNGQKIALSGGGTLYNFKMPAADVSVQAVFTAG